MAQESPAQLRKRTGRIFEILSKRYPDARCMLDHANPLELLVATILAAQCTDERVNRVTPALFRKYRTARDYASADPRTLEEEVRSTGFFRNKARSTIGCCRKIAEEFGGQVPDSMEGLTSLPGVGRKTANVVLSECFGKPGIIVDTHLKRVVARLGLARLADPDRIEAEMNLLVPESQRAAFSHAITFHGRSICRAPKPSCHRCPVTSLCDFFAGDRGL